MIPRTPRFARFVCTQYTPHFPYEDSNRVLAGLAGVRGEEEKQMVLREEEIDVPRMNAHEILPRVDLFELVHHVHPRR